MDRRELIKALLPVALIPAVKLEDGSLGAGAAPIPKGNYLLFVDARSVRVDDLQDMLQGLPEGVSMQVQAVRFPIGDSIDQHIALYKLES